MIGRFTLLCLLFATNAAAQDSEPTDSLLLQRTSPTLTDRFHQVQQYLDNRAKGMVDPAYIEVPEKP